MDDAEIKSLHKELTGLRQSVVEKYPTDEDYQKACRFYRCESCSYFDHVDPQNALPEKCRSCGGSTEEISLEEYRQLNVDHFGSYEW